MSRAKGAQGAVRNNASDKAGLLITEHAFLSGNGVGEEVAKQNLIADGHGVGLPPESTGGVSSMST